MKFVLQVSIITNLKSETGVTPNKNYSQPDKPVLLYGEPILSLGLPLWREAQTSNSP
jgi:hypothetical protein